MKLLNKLFFLLFINACSLRYTECYKHESNPFKIDTLKFKYELSTNINDSILTVSYSILSKNNGIQKRQVDYIDLQLTDVQNCKTEFLGLNSLFGSQTKYMHYGELPQSEKYAEFNEDFTVYYYYKIEKKDDSRIKVVLKSKCNDEEINIQSSMAYVKNSSWLINGVH